jgi:hypoxanthine phosphoribosyltransferase
MMPTVETNTRLELPDIARRLKALSLPDVDAVVGIATGGVAFASIVAFWLEKPLHIIHLNYRDENNKPRHQNPTLLKPFDVDTTLFNKGLKHLASSETTENSRPRLLLVDDVSVTGATLETAKKLLTNFQVTTLVLKGKANVVLYPEVKTCILLPWRDA